MDKLIQEINNAEESVKLITPYLIVTNELMNALISAASRGVVINIITTGRADKKTAYTAATYYAEKLNSYGIKVMRTDNFFMHAKAYMIDDHTTIIGTSNIDYRALFLHYETNIVVTNKKFTSEMLNYFDDLAKRTYLVTNKSKD
jgi:cardiolipin synthase